MEQVETPEQTAAVAAFDRWLRDQQTAANVKDTANEVSAVNTVLERIRVAKLLCQQEFAGPVSPDAIVAIAVAIGSVRQSGQFSV